MTRRRVQMPPRCRECGRRHYPNVTCEQARPAGAMPAAVREQIDGHLRRSRVYWSGQL